MWTFVKSIFGGSDSASKAMDLVSDSVKGIGGFIDEQQFTPEERSKAAGEAVSAHLELMKAISNENSTRSVTRRWLAWGVTCFILVWASVGMVFAILEKPETVKSMLAIVEAYSLGWTFLAVMGFYFGVQLLRK